MQESEIRRVVFRAHWLQFRVMFVGMDEKASGDRYLIRLGFDLV